jgi:hypothetical protein
MSRDNTARQNTAADAARGHAAFSYRESRGNVGRRIDRGETPVLCHVCGTETDVTPQAHQPGCPITPHVEVRVVEGGGTRYKGRNGQVMSTRVHAADGSKTGSEVTREHDAWQDLQPIVEMCVLCPGWSVTTTVAKGRAVARRHREKKHPELAAVKKRWTPKTAATLAREARELARLEQTAGRLEAL